jgi:hypothetical protein
VQKSSDLHANDEELDQVKQLPVKGKGRSKVKEETDEMRVRIEAKLLEGTATLRRV